MKAFKVPLAPSGQMAYWKEDVEQALAFMIKAAELCCVESVDEEIDRAWVMRTAILGALEHAKRTALESNG